MLVAHADLRVTLQEQFFVVADPVKHLEIFTRNRGREKQTNKVLGMKKETVQSIDSPQF